MIAAIVGAGPLATALASTLAARGRVRHVRLIDDAATVATGKALDVRQSTPVLGSDVSIEATADLAAAADADVILLADAHGSPAVEWEGEFGLALLGRLVSVNARAPIVCAGSRQASLVERGVAEVRSAVDADPRLGGHRLRRGGPGHRGGGCRDRGAQRVAGPRRVAAFAARRRLERVVDRRRTGREPPRPRRTRHRHPPPDRRLAARPVRARGRRRRSPRTPRRGQPRRAAGHRRDPGPGTPRRNRPRPGRSFGRPAMRPSRRCRRMSASRSTMPSHSGDSRLAV